MEALLQSLLQHSRDPLIINSVGLGLDIAGAIFLAIYGLPNRKVIQDLVFKGALAVAIRKFDKQRGSAGRVSRYQRWGRRGLYLLIAGFSLQILSNAMQGGWLGLPWW